MDYIPGKRCGYFIPPMLRLGALTLDAPFFQAGLAGYSDAPMRLIARRHGAPYAVTEAMLDETLIRGGKGLRDAELDAEDHPIAGQLMGSHPAQIAQGARLLVGLGYDVIDVNLACPVKRIRKLARGGHLLAEPDEAIAVLDAVRQAVGEARPCTVKLRRGSDLGAEAEANFRRVLEAAMRLGYAGAVVHGRTVEQKYIGPASWDFLAGLVRDYGGGDFVLGGSGDVWCGADVARMLEQTGVRLVSIARGAIANPWIFRQARAALAGDAAGAARPPSVAEQRATLLEHAQLAVARDGEERAGPMLRKLGIRAARHHPRSEEVARAFIAVKDMPQWFAVVAEHYAVDEPGVDSRPLGAEQESCAGAAG
jgi:tRNA-dihydrouridine synthase B